MFPRLARVWGAVVLQRCHTAAWWSGRRRRRQARSIARLPRKPRHLRRADRHIILAQIRHNLLEHGPELHRALGRARLPRQPAVDGDKVPVER